MNMRPSYNRVIMVSNKVVNFDFFSNVPRSNLIIFYKDVTLTDNVTQVTLEFVQN